MEKTVTEAIQYRRSVRVFDKDIEIENYTNTKSTIKC